jgi:hypothetical protein
MIGHVPPRLAFPTGQRPFAVIMPLEYKARIH